MSICTEQVNAACDAIAEQLVNRRVQRANTMRWKSFALRTKYKCPLDLCSEQNLPFEHRNALMDHLRAVHDFPPPVAEHYEKIKRVLDEGRIKS